MCSALRDFYPGEASVNFQNQVESNSNLQNNDKKEWVEKEAETKKVDFLDNRGEKIAAISLELQECGDECKDTLLRRDYRQLKSLYIESSDGKKKINLFDLYSFSLSDVSVFVRINGEARTNNFSYIDKVIKVNFPKDQNQLAKLLHELGHMEHSEEEEWDDFNKMYRNTSSIAIAGLEGRVPQDEVDILIKHFPQLEDRFYAKNMEEYWEIVKQIDGINRRLDILFADSENNKVEIDQIVESLHTLEERADSILKSNGLYEIRKLPYLFLEALASRRAYEHILAINKELGLEGVGLLESFNEPDASTGNSKVVYPAKELEIAYKIYCRNLKDLAAYLPYPIQ